ncbi:suppressor of tub2 mutation [Borealophlyctis nickersoniae]|nr:suppressor of tub2 mutation [Borealophlyctis nickersoniae]
MPEMPSLLPTPAKASGAAPASSTVNGGTAAPDPDPIDFLSERELEKEVTEFLETFKGKESEQNWDAREMALQRLRGICRGNAINKGCFIGFLQLMMEPIIKSMHSLRTAMVMTTCNTVTDLANALQSQLDPMVDSLLTNLLKLTGQSKKLVATASSNTATVLLQRTTYKPKYLQYFLTALADKSAGTRGSAAVFVKVVLEQMVSTDANKATLEKTGGLESIEKCLKKGLQDATPSVREASRDTFTVYQKHWQDKSQCFIDSLDPSARKAILRHKTSSASIRTRPSVASLISKRSQSALGFTSAKSNSAESIPSGTESLSKTDAVEDVPDQAHHSATKLNKPMLRTPVKFTRTNSAPESPAKSQTSETDAIVQKLRSFDGTQRLEGCQALFNMLQIPGWKTESASGQADLRSAVVARFSDDFEEVGRVMAERGHVELLVKTEIVTLEEVIGAIFRLGYSRAEPHMVERTRKILEALRHSFPTSQTLTAFEKCLAGGRGSSLQRIKDGDVGILSYVVEWMEEIIANPNDQHGSDGVTDFFEQAENVRTFMAALTPLLSGEVISLNMEERIYRLLAVFSHAQPTVFDEVVGNMEPDVAHRLRNALGLASVEKRPIGLSVPRHGDMGVGRVGEGDSLADLSRIEGGEGATMVDVTFEAAHEASSVFQMDGRGLCDETLPDGFADLSMRSISVSPPRYRLAGGLSTADPRDDRDIFQTRAGTGGPPSVFHTPVAMAQSSARYAESDGGNATSLETPRDDEWWQQSQEGSRNIGLPVKPLIRWKRDTQAVLFAQKTPTPMRPNKSDAAKELPKLLSQLSKGNATNSTMRRLCRMSGAFRVTDEPDEDNRHAGITLWDTWFAETLAVLFESLTRHAKDKILYETGLLFLKMLMENQTPFFRGHERETLEVLLICRSDGSAPVSGSAEDALSCMLNTLEPLSCLRGCIELLSDCDVNKPDIENTKYKFFRASHYGRFARDDDDDVADYQPQPVADYQPQPVADYQPPPVASAYQVLGKLVGRLGAADVDRYGVLESIVVVLLKVCGQAKIH